VSTVARDSIGDVGSVSCDSLVIEDDCSLMADPDQSSINNHQSTTIHKSKIINQK
jgi:hypothetical protein